MLLTTNVNKQMFGGLSMDTVRELNPDVDQLYSVEAAAELLSLSPWTLRAWIQSKKIKSAKLGSRRLIAKSEIKRLIRESAD
jgi:excisionase family DNA binding protein